METMAKLKWKIIISGYQTFKIRQLEGDDQNV